MFRDWKVYHTSVSEGTITLLDNVVNARITFNSDAKSNSVEMVLNNNAKKCFKNGEFIYQTDDFLTIYAAEGFVDITNPDHLIGTFFIKNHKITPDIKHITIEAGDNTYKMLNKVYSGDFPSDAGQTSRSLIFNVVQVADSNGLTQNAVTTSMVSTKSDGGSFPVISYAASNKTNYDVVAELSQPEYTGDNRTYLFWYDEFGKFYWTYPSMVSTGTLTYGSGDVISMKFDRKESETISSIIYNAGKNLNDITITNMYHDPTSTSTNIKYKTMLDINQYIRNNIKKAYSLPDVENETLLNVVTNEQFESLVENACNGRAALFINKYSRGLWEADVAVKGQKITMSSLYSLVDNITGFAPPNLRVVRVVHIINKNGWNTQINLEEDSDEV